MARRVLIISDMFFLMHIEPSLMISKGATLSQYSVLLKVQESFPSSTHHLFKLLFDKVVLQAI